MTGKQKGRTIVEDTLWCCRSNLPIFGPSDGFAKDGELWTCQTCGEQWEHICDEAEGCSWQPAIPF